MTHRDARSDSFSMLEMISFLTCAGVVESSASMVAKFLCQYKFDGVFGDDFHCGSFYFCQGKADDRDFIYLLSWSIQNRNG